MESAAIRRRTMQAVKSKDTAPELAVRRLAHRMGYRFRLHRKDLPGKPDLVFPRLHKVVFVHGCFWHGHECARCAGAGAEPRLLDEEDCANKDRHQAAHTALAALGWEVTVLWECEIRDQDRTLRQLRAFLG